MAGHEKHREFICSRVSCGHKFRLIGKFLRQNLALRDGGRGLRRVERVTVDRRVPAARHEKTRRAVAFAGQSEARRAASPTSFGALEGKMKPKPSGPLEVVRSSECAVLIFAVPCHSAGRLSKHHLSFERVATAPRLGLCPVPARSHDTARTAANATATTTTTAERVIFGRMDGIRNRNFQSESAFPARPCRTEHQPGC